METIVQNPATSYYYSTLANDPDLAEIVDMFVDEMPGRVTALKTEYDASNWEQLGRLAHQLKGAAGSYGFGQITTFAATLEQAVRKNYPANEIEAAYAMLTDACNRVRSGSGS